MTISFDLSLLKIMEDLIGIKIMQENYLWSNQKKMARWNIKINAHFIMQSTRVIKSVLSSTLADNLTKKIIIYTNTLHHTSEN